MPSKLYYTEHGCGAAAFIAAHLGGLIGTKVIPVKVDLADNILTETGADYLKINSRGNAPALVLRDGTVLNEGVVVLLALADAAAPEAQLAPQSGTPRLVLLNYMCFIASELHSSFSPLFVHGQSEAAKEAERAAVAKKLELAEAMLAGRHYVLGEALTVADIYLYIVLSWHKFTGISLAPAFPGCAAFEARIDALPAVREAHAAMAAAP